MTRSRRESATGDDHECTQSIECQGPDRQKWSLPGLGKLAVSQANHRYEFGRRVGQMDCRACISGASNVRAVPLRTQREEAVLRQHAYQSRIRRYGNSQPRTLSKPGEGHARSHAVADGRGTAVCLRALLRPARTGVESGERNGQSERKEEFRETGRRL